MCGAVGNGVCARRGCVRLRPPRTIASTQTATTGKKQKRKKEQHACNHPSTHPSPAAFLPFLELFLDGVFAMVCVD